MKNNNTQDYKDYLKAKKLSRQITQIMTSETQSENNELKDWIMSDNSSKETVERLSDEATLSELCKNYDREERHLQSDKLIKALNSKKPKTVRLRIIKLSLAIASALIAVSLLVFNSERNPHPSEKLTITTLKTVKEVVITNPTLILNNGESIDLTNNNNEINELATVSNNILKYRKLSKAQTNTTHQPEFNTLVIPKQFTYNVELEDGTKVYLNASSELKYPTKFKGDKREVFLKGEAFFEVTKSNIPFVVSTGDISVKVYGTQFNINSYNQNNIQTVLVEGSVGVTYQDGNETRMKPNQLLTINSKGIKTISDISCDKYLAWMSGFIRNDEEPISNLFDNLGNWYGVEFICDDMIKNINISASINRKRPIGEVIKAIEEISGVKIIKTGENKYMVK